MWQSEIRRTADELKLVPTILNNVQKEVNIPKHPVTEICSHSNTNGTSLV